MSLKRKLSPESEAPPPAEPETLSPYFSKPNPSSTVAGHSGLTISALSPVTTSSSCATSFLSSPCTTSFFSSPCNNLARSLLGCSLCRLTTLGQVLKGKIVETESYPGSSDGASHSYKGQTARNRAMFMEPGTAYVYAIYGMYRCFNISSEGKGAAVLVRALEPLQGEVVMRENRSAKRKEGAKQLKLKDLCSGPSKLCQALDIDRALDQADLATSKEIWVERGLEEVGEKIVNTTRVGIEGTGEEWSKLRLRWYVMGNQHVSVRDRQEEQRMEVTQ